MDPQYLKVPIRSDKFSLNIKSHRRLCHRKTEFQTIEIYETDAFGKVLLLDGHIQLTELDEAAYHECLVHVPLLSLSEPRRALVIGGGDGGVLRELCKHSTLEQIDIVEIDAGVVQASLEFMPELSKGAFNDPRVNLHLQDAFPFVKQPLEPYDLVIMDSTDTYEDEEGALSEQLFTADFYQDLYRLLHPSGLVVTQADNPIFCPYSLESIRDQFSTVFPVVGDYWAVVPSFGGCSGYCYASKATKISAERASLLSGLKLRYLTPAIYAMSLEGLPFASQC